MWFSKSIEEVLKEIHVDPSHGLSEEEAKVRLEKYGANKLQGKKKKNIFQMFIAQLKDWLIYIGWVYETFGIQGVALSNRDNVY
ncbi:MAG: cation-transporting P-type ATPase [Bacteroidales bacterium]|nr:cation-transporting P-type ATPase [Bacteroidales bacterium]